MKRQALTAMAAALLLVPAAASAVSYYQDGGYGDGGVILRMDVPMGTVVNPGEEISFTYQTLQDAFVLVFNIDSGGYVHLLHPHGSLEKSRARRTYRLPDPSASSLVVRGETGVEFVFALTVPLRTWIDDEELEHLAGSGGRSGTDPYRIDGDPFTAANIIAAELVRGISRREGVFLDFTYFYVNQRVDYPCYLCGECDDPDAETDCDLYRIVANFDHSRPLVYPLRPGFEMVNRDEVVAEDTQSESVDVTFYPYRTEVYTVSRPYVYRVWDPWYYDPWYWDPWCSGWGYYPGYYSGWSWGISIGWGWGWAGWGWGWGGYWSSGWCRPYYACYYPGYAGYYRAERFKTRYRSGAGSSYKSATLASGYRRSVERDGSMRLGSKNTRSVAKATSYRAPRSAKRIDTSRATRTARRSSYQRVGKTRVKGTARDRSARQYRSKATPRAYSRQKARQTRSKSTSSVRGSSRRSGIKVQRGTSPKRIGQTGWRTLRQPRSSTLRPGSGSAPRSLRSAPRSGTRRPAVRSAPRSSGRSRVSAPRSRGSSPRVRSSAPRSSSRSSARRSGGASRSRSGGKRR